MINIINKITQPVLQADASEAQQAIISQLKKIPLLAGVNDTGLLKVISAFQFHSVSKGQIILSKGAAGDHLLFLFSGRLQAIGMNDNWHVPGAAFVLAGDYFGELSIIDALSQPTTLVASEPSTYALLPRRDALDLIYNNPLVSEQVSKKMAAHIRQASNFRNILAIPNAFQRVYALLNHLSKASLSGLVVIENLPTQQEISIMINTSRETVSRAIQVLIQSGVIEKDLRRLIVRNPDALRDESNMAKLLPDQIKP